MLLLLLASVQGLGQSERLDCSGFKTGQFSMPSTGIENYIIVRKKHKQMEYAMGKKSVLKVKWISECTYTLTPTKRTLRKSPQMPKNVVLTVTIIQALANGYLQTTTEPILGYINTSEVIMLPDK